ncbi:Alpha/beta hydrolase fold-1 [Fusarium avenaceum]|nr:Alpha/beta hydrolase fold-1 [Fusarium avenaceum]
MGSPIVVIVPGSFAPGKHYNTFTESLEKNGIASRVIETPSVGRKDPLPPQTMSDDAAEITKVVTELFDQGKEVVLMTHSYGGIPGTQCLKDLSRKARKDQGKEGGIDKIIYLASVVLQPGASNFDAFGAAMPDFVTVTDDYMTLDPKGHASSTFSDLPADEALELAKQMPEHSTPSFKEPLTYPGYNDVEVHYIVCEQDKIIPPMFQRGMIEAVKMSAGKDVKVHSLDSGHVPVISQPDNVSKIVKKIIDG